MIVRLWTGRANPGDELAYVAHLEQVVIPEIRAVSGNRGAQVLRGLGERGRDFVVLTYWTDLESIEAFAGSDVRTAVVPAEARALLSDFEPVANHFDVVLETR
jgi:heme-degrading monooxygenase HmoA